ncbi:hypothetical protein SPHINGO8AM_60092 [Sphingomonas sp. 8AM]|nr:hypothetical protein SPHINGO8AM_60092 [Sphingomonas sp. 8AM]
MRPNERGVDIKPPILRHADEQVTLHGLHVTRADVFERNNRMIYRTQRAGRDPVMVFNPSRYRLHVP